MKYQTIGRLNLVFALVALALILTLAAPVMAQGGPRGNGPGLSSGNGVAVEPLTADEVAWLTYMREEEKLARDVYRQLHEKWNVSIFDIISQSEDRHFNAVGQRLVRYQVADPAEGLSAGVYANADLAALYQALMEKGTRSLQDALEVGVLIEKTDIDDLETALSTSEKLDIKRVYTNLLEGSFNHLEAFETTLEAVCVAAQAN